jgi:hypothetical protein
MKANSPRTQKLMHAFKLHKTQQLHQEFDECIKNLRNKNTHLQLRKAVHCCPLRKAVEWPTEEKEEAAHRSPSHAVAGEGRHRPIGSGRRRGCARRRWLRWSRRLRQVEKARRAPSHAVAGEERRARGACERRLRARAVDARETAACAREEVAAHRKP